MSQLALHAFEFADLGNIGNLTWLSDVHQFWVVVRATRTRQCELVGQKNELAEGIK